MNKISHVMKTASTKLTSETVIWLTTSFVAPDSGEERSHLFGHHSGENVSTGLAHMEGQWYDRDMRRQWSQA